MDSTKSKQGDGLTNDSLLSLISPEDQSMLGAAGCAHVARVPLESNKPSALDSLPEANEHLETTLLNLHATADDWKSVCLNLYRLLNRLALEHQNLRARHSKTLVELIMQPIKQNVFCARTHHVPASDDGGDNTEKPESEKRRKDREEIARVADAAIAKLVKERRVAEQMTGIIDLRSGH